MTVPTIFDMTAANAALKELYDDQIVQNVVLQDEPALSLIRKNTDFGGKNKPIPIIIGNSQGRSSDFATAQANQTAADVRAFSLVRKKDYSIATLDNETMEASAIDIGSFIDDAKLVIDAAIRSIKDSICSTLFGNGTGSIGKITTISTGVITLADPNTVVKFQLNQTLQASATDGAAPRAALGYVIAVDYDAGTVTVASSALGGSAASPNAWAPNDFLLVQGDSNAKPMGFAGWLPFTAPTGGDSFFGQDRSANPTLLAGVRYDGSGLSIQEALTDAVVRSNRIEGRPNTVVTNYISWGALEKELSGQVQYVDLKGPGEIMFKAIKVNGPKGPLNVVPDRSCPGFIAYGLQLDTWALEGLGLTPHIVRTGSGGDDMLRVYNKDAAEVRLAAYYNIRTNAPGWNFVAKLSA